MDERLVASVCWKIINGLEGSYVVYSDDAVVEWMRNRENLLGFLALFGDAIDIKNNSCYWHGNCKECKNSCGFDGNECIRCMLKSITENEGKKYRIVCSRTEGDITNKMILPGKFTKEDAMQIVDAYVKSSTPPEYSYSIEEAV